MEQDTEQPNLYEAQVGHGPVLELINSMKVGETKRPNSLETVTSIYQKAKIKRMKITHVDSSLSTENVVHKIISSDTISTLLTQAEPVHCENLDNAPTGVDIDHFTAAATKSPPNVNGLSSTGSNFINKAMSLLEIGVKHLQESHAISSKALQEENDHLKAEVEDLKKQLMAERAKVKTESKEKDQLYVRLNNERVKFEKELQIETERRKKYYDLKTAKKAKELDESRNHTNQFKLKRPHENNTSSAKKFKQLEAQMEESKKQSSEKNTDMHWYYELKTDMHTAGSDVCRFDDQQKEEYRAFANSIVGWIKGMQKERDELFHIVNNLQEMISEAILGEPIDTLPEPRWMTEQTEAWQEGYNHGYYEGWWVGFRQFGHWINENLPSHWRHN